MADSTTELAVRDKVVVITGVRAGSDRNSHEAWRRQELLSLLRT